MVFLVIFLPSFKVGLSSIIFVAFTLPPFISHHQTILIFFLCFPFILSICAIPFISSFLLLSIVLMQASTSSFFFSSLIQLSPIHTPSLASLQSCKICLSILLVSFYRTTLLKFSSNHSKLAESVSLSFSPFLHFSPLLILGT